MGPIQGPKGIFRTIVLVPGGQQGMLKRTVAEERKFEQELVLKQAQAYLSSDVLEKARTDEGYRAKVEQIERQIAGI